MITKDGGISANYILGGLIVLSVGLISKVFYNSLSSINDNVKRIEKNVENIGSDLKQVKDDFNDFLVTQSALNAKLIEKTKDL